ncbi:MAG: glycosyltransferase family 4 protein [Phycisphaerae bacterium]|nr:glycosyltransferase family 4 protein [Phycisphaerae bacterium]
MQVDKFYDRSCSAAGGVGKQIELLTSQLAARGYDVLQFGTRMGDSPPEMPKYFDFKATRNPLAIFRMIHNRTAAKLLGEFLTREKVDVAHLHNLYHHLTPSILSVLAAHKIPMVMTLHDYRLACPTRHFYRPRLSTPDALCTRCVGGHFFHAASPKCAGFGGAGLAIESYVQHWLRRYMKYIRTFICPTEFMRQTMQHMGIAPDQLKVVPNIIATAPGSSNLTADADNIVLFVGRLSPEKGPELMLDLAGNLPAAKIVIAGDGPLRGELEQRARNENLSNAEFIGHVSADVVADLYQQAAVVVIPSRCMENSPTTMLEAMLAARAVVVPDQPPLRYWVSDGQTGKFFPTGDANALTETVKELLGDKKLRARLGAAGRELVSQRHDPKTVIDQLEKLYTMVMQCE